MLFRSASGRLGVDALIRLAGETDWDGTPALADSGVRRKLADFYIRSKGLQFTGNRTLTALSRGRPRRVLPARPGMPARAELR